MNTSLFVGIYQELLRAWPNRWLGYSFALIVAAIVALVVTVLPDQYQSKAKVYINSAVVLEPLIQGLAVGDDSEKRVRLLRVFQTILVSKENVDRLIKTPGMGFDTSTAAARSRAYDLIKAGLTVTEEDQNLFALDFIDTNPVRARNVAHGLLSLFIERNIVDARNELTAARAFLDKQIAEYEIKLREVETQIAEFQVRNVDALGTSTYQTRLATARTVLREAQLARQIAVETRTRIQEKIRTNPEAAPLLIANDTTYPSVIERMSALQNQLNQLLLQYTDKHPDVIATRREMALLSEQYGLGAAVGEAATKPFTQLPGQVPPSGAVDGAVPPTTTAVASAAGSATTQPAAARQTVSAAVSAGRVQLLQASLAVMDAERRVSLAESALRAIEQMASTAPAAETGLEQLNRDQAVLRENYEQLLRRRESARMRTAADLSSGMEQFRIVVSPSIPEEPTGPDRRTFLLLGTLLAVVTGGALAYALGLLRGTFVSAAEAESALGLPVIARLTDRHGVLSRVGASADTLVLLGAVVGLFLAAYILSAATELMSPVRTEIYRFFEGGLGAILGVVGG